MQEWGVLDGKVRAVIEGYPDLRLSKGRKVGAKVKTAIPCD
jgi:hypothetical protein